MSMPYLPPYLSVTSEIAVTDDADFVVFGDQRQSAKIRVIWVYPSRPHIFEFSAELHGIDRCGQSGLQLLKKLAR
ncbi:MAG: hypothetical protein U0Y68_06180 [Blastocatellia bacterium]